MLTTMAQSPALYPIPILVHWSILGKNGTSDHVMELDSFIAPRPQTGLQENREILGENLADIHL